MTAPYLKKLLGEKEKVLFVAHQHWWLLARTIIPEIVLFIMLVWLVTFVWINFIPSRTVAFAYLLLLLPVVSLIRDTLIWSTHKYVVTTHRVIQIIGVFNKSVTDSSLEKVNDVKLEQTFWGRLLGYGDIEILTASELGVNRFALLGRPVRFKTAMLNAKNTLDKEPTDLLSQLKRLHEQGVLTDQEFQQKKKALLDK